MPIVVFCLGVLVLSVMHTCQSRFETRIVYQRTFIGGTADTATAVIKAIDSLQYSIGYESPSRSFPTGGYYFSETPHTPSPDRFYCLPQVIKIVPISSSSQRIFTPWQFWPIPEIKKLLK